MVSIVQPIIILTLLMVLSAPVMADWPSSMEIGGFTVTGITGTTNADGSGRATGKLSIPGDGTCPVDLVRSSSGLVTGSARGSFSVGKLRVDGSFVLDRRGMQGTGIVHTQGKPIVDANLAITDHGVISGRGKVKLGQGFAVNVVCETKEQEITARGSSARQVTVDTPLAVYTFKGDIHISGSGDALKATANGTIERKGKVGGMTNTIGPLNFDVDIASGQASLNVGGTAIFLDLW